MTGMPKEVRDRWVGGLRSGEYEQGVGQFEAEGKFCCLGVLCDVMGQPVRLEETEKYRGTDNEQFVSQLLPVSQMRSLAYKNDGPAYPGAGAGAKVHTFDQIADWIEEHVEVTP